MIIKTIKATKIYNQGQTNEVIAVNKATIKVKSGDVAVLKGPSGSGKTTLLSMIGCQIKPNKGEVQIGDKRVSKLPDKFLNSFKRENIGFIFQNYQLIADLSVMDNIMLPLLPTGAPQKERIKRADKLMEMFDLVKRSSFKVKNLSGGEQQRVAIARALANQGTIILADEPTAHLDIQLTKKFLDSMKLLKQLNYTIILSSHDPEIFGSPLVDQVFEMKDGRVLK
jgi:putative ABC transport system ATP-binding protein